MRVLTSPASATSDDVSEVVTGGTAASATSTGDGTGTGPGEGMTRCSNCGDDVPSARFVMHSAFCERHNVRCTVAGCGAVVHKSEQEKHWHWCVGAVWCGMRTLFTCLSVGGGVGGARMVCACASHCIAAWLQPRVLRAHARSTWEQTHHGTCPVSIAALSTCRRVGSHCWSCCVVGCCEPAVPYTHGV